MSPTPSGALSATRGAKRPHTSVDIENRRNDPKTSRACDLCKSKKIRCSGTLPCEKCTRRKAVCTYDAKYVRGRPPTPPLSMSPNQGNERGGQEHSSRVRSSNEITIENPRDVSSRVSPELEIEGQYFDPTSGLNFLHRAWKKVFAQRAGMASDGSSEVDRHQLLTSAGDRPFYGNGGISDSSCIPDDVTARTLLAFYFDTCVVTYRMLHRQTTESWMEVFLRDRTQGLPLAHSLSHAKCAILLTILAIATFRQQTIYGAIAAENEAIALRQSDLLFCTAMHLTDTEKGFPRLESAQARLIQVLYLLQTSRMNKGWYTFGNAFHITSSLGLHRRRDHKRGVSLKRGHSDYINSQCCKRTFWVAYIIDRYLSVVFGRPRLYQDDDIDQEFPDSVNDEDMTRQGTAVSDTSDCYIVALILHAKIARIIGRISREVYSVGNIPNHVRVTAAYRLCEELHEWRASLPLHLGSIKPSTLIPSFRRQAIALQLAYSHAIIHANRPFILGDETPQSDTPRLINSTAECISAAKTTLELVDQMASESNLFHSFWWTHYVTFCALVVVYVWEIQRRRSFTRQDDHIELFDLAERCRSHLSRATPGASPSRRYNIILEELRLEAHHQAIREQQTNFNSTQPVDNSDHQRLSSNAEVPGPSGVEYTFQENFGAVPSSLDTWQITDWLDLDSSAFDPFPDVTAVSPSWLSMS